MATALDEAMSLVLHDQGTYALTGRLEIELTAPAPVGSFVQVTADVESEDERKLLLSAEAEVEGERLAAARGVFVRMARGC